MPERTTPNNSTAFLKAALPVIIFFVLLMCPLKASAQSFGIGFGLGIPFMDYITAQVDRDYRVTPTPGYYPILKDLTNSAGSIHLNASLLLNIGLPVDLEIRFDTASMTWKNSTVTHVTCEPVDIVNDTFNDAIASYVPLNKVDEKCLNRNTYNATKSIADDNLSNLWFFHISGGIRYPFFRSDNWSVYTAAHLGFSIATMFSGDTWLGGNIDALIGFMYRLSDIIWVEFDIKLLFMLTQVPDDTQSRINHETQTGGNIFTSLVQPNAYIDFQVSIRFDFSDL